MRFSIWYAMAFWLLSGLMSHSAAQSKKALMVQERLTRKSEEIIADLSKDSLRLPSGKKSLPAVIDAFLTRMYTTRTDTNYVARPATKWTIKTKLNMSATELRVNGTSKSGGQYVYEMENEPKVTLGINLSYKGLSGSLSLNPGKITGRNSDTEWNFNLYNNAYGADLVINNLRSFSGEANGEGGKRDADFSGVKLQSVTLNGYYVFNKRRFSYPAAFTQSYIQKKSQGSFLVGASFSTGALETPGSLLQTEDGCDIRRIGMTHITAGAGYAYNYVPARKWLLHLSALPSFVVWKNYKIHLAEGTTKMPWRFFDVFIVGRFSATYSTGFYFFGVTQVYQMSKIGDEEKFSLTREHYRMRLFAGIRF